MGKKEEICGIPKEILQKSFPGVHLSIFKFLFEKAPVIQLERLQFCDSILDKIKLEADKLEIQPYFVDIDLGEIDLKADTFSLTQKSQRKYYNLRKRNGNKYIGINSSGSSSEPEESDTDFEIANPDSNSQRIFKCSYKNCDQEFAHKSMYQKHLIIHKAKKQGSTICPICNRHCLTRSILHRHIRQSHPPKPDPEFADLTEQNRILASEKIRCKIEGCGKKFKFKAHLLSHRRASHNMRPKDICLRCGKRFKNPITRWEHFKFRCRNRQYPYTCPQDGCPRKFRSITLFGFHKLSHEYPDWERDISKNKCPICSKGFMAKNILKRHVESSHLSLTLACAICGKQLASRENLHNHLEKVHSELNKFGCEKCGSKFGTQERLDRHMKFHNSRIKFPFACEICDGWVAFAEKRSLEEHQRRHSEGSCRNGTKLESFKKMNLDPKFQIKSEPLECEICSKSFTIRLTFDLHRLEHEHPNLRKIFTDGICVICEKLCFNKFPHHHLRRHLPGNRNTFCSFPGCKMYIRKDQIQSHELLHQNQSAIKCPHPSCSSKVFANQRSLSNHARIRHVSVKCEFPGCGAIFDAKKELNCHFKKSHESYICESCGKSFLEKKSLISHIMSKHKGETPFKCTFPGCKKSYAEKVKLNQHIKTHTQRAICEVCGVVYKSREGLDSHFNRVHLNKFQSCTWEGCNAKLKDKDSLDKHLAKHAKNEEKIKERQKKIRESDGPKFPCEKCDKIYTQAQSLRFHMRTIHVDKKFECKFKDCGKLFAEKRGLELHSVVHDNVKMKCQFCEKSFTKYFLKFHVSEKHKKERDFPFKCKECGDSFMRNKCLENHIEKNHKN